MQIRTYLPSLLRWLSTCFHCASSLKVSFNTFRCGSRKSGVSSSSQRDGRQVLRKQIWILDDGRPGTVSQSIGLAEELGIPYEKISLTYNFLVGIPNCFFSDSLIRLSKKTKSEIKNLDYLPSLVISAGRRCATTALYLKKISQNQIKIIQIMNPDLDFSKFDLVILPKHDQVKSSAQNLVTTIGALTKVNEKNILAEKTKFAGELQSDKKIIALMLGGPSKKTKFTGDSAKNLGEILSKIAGKMNAKLLILSSRRTSDEISENLKSNLKCDFKFFNWAEVKDRNPYLAILGLADFFVITGDSVSMISECCSTGKPVYIFDEKEISSEKHRRFHQNLIEENYAKKLLQSFEQLENFTTKKLEETKRIADLIKTRMGDKF